MSAAHALVGVLALSGNLLRQIVVLIPAAMEELDEADAALRQPARQQAVGRERAGLARISAVQLKRPCAGSLERSVRSGTDVCIRYAISYCAMRVAISGSPNSIQLHLVQPRQIVDETAAGVRD